MKKALYSPTVVYSYRIHEDWWKENGGGRRKKKPKYDYDGYDECGYDSSGRDRVWYTVDDYESDPKLYETVKGQFDKLIRSMDFFGFFEDDDED